VNNTLELYLQNNEISQLPEDVALLGTLEMVDVSGCRFTELPAIVLRIPSLQSLRYARKKRTSIILFGF
jgi:Leucine-rich repeat (LRR) protein